MPTSIISENFRFLTPAFPHGVYQGQRDNVPELRAPSIRGQLRWWWRTLGYGIGDELFGSIAGNGNASRVQVRLTSPINLQTSEAEILPHKEKPGHRGTKNCLTQWSDRFEIQLRPVRASLSKDQLANLQHTLRAWILMGGVGQRANRAAGSPWPEEDAPKNLKDYLTTCRELLKKSTSAIAILPHAFENTEELRNLAGRFPARNSGQVFGSARPRKSSSLKLRAIFVEGQYHLAALWCPKDQNDTPQNLRRAIEEMSRIEAKRELGQLLEKVLPDLT